MKINKIKIISLLLCILLFLSTQVFSNDNERLAKLIKQFKGDACYWNQFGEKTSFFDRWTNRHYEENCKITAAKMLGEMGPEAKKAVPVLIEALKKGPNDIDTGDGILPYRSTIAIALGKIGDPIAIPPLIEKLKSKERVTISPSASLPVNWEFPVGVEHKAIVEALGMFGPQAKKAIPYLDALLKDSQDEQLREIIEIALKRIRNTNSLSSPDDFFTRDPEATYEGNTLYVIEIPGYKLDPESVLVISIGKEEYEYAHHINPKSEIIHRLCR